MHFNVDSICNGLQSTKIRERSDTLSILEDYIQANALSTTAAKVGSSLMVLTFDLINYEKVLFLKSESSSVENRLCRASSCVKSLVEQAVRNMSKPELPTKFKFRYKHFLLILNSIRDTITVEDPDQLFWPCSLDLILTVSTILQQGFVKDHLGQSDWLKVYRFLVRIITVVLLQQFPLQNERILLELFNSLANLIQATYQISVTYLPLMYKREYFKLIPPITKAIHIMTRENALTVVIQKIINKLIIVLSTEDIQFVSRLVRLGLKQLVSYNNTKLDSLQLQLIYFINIPATHDFITLKNMPHLSGEPTNDMDISIRSGDEEDDDEDVEEATYTTDEDIDILLYNLSSVIQSLFSILIQSRNLLQEHDIEFFYSTLTDGDWYTLSSIHFTNRNPKSTNNSNSWLLHLGISKLLNTFFKIKLTSNKKLNSGTPDPFRVKRQKTDIVQNELINADDPIEFCLKILTTRPNTDFQKSVLQVFIFFLQSNTNKHQTEKCQLSFPTQQNTDNSLLEIDYPSLSDANFTNTTTSFSINAALQIILSLFDSASISYWLLLASKSILENTLQFKPSLPSLRQFQQLFKLSLLSINHEIECRVACDLIHLMSTQISSHGLIQVVDSSIGVQLENVIDLANVNGPNVVCTQSFLFWYSVSSIVKLANLPTRTEVQNKAQSWLLSKWDSFLGTLMLDEQICFDTSSGLAEFVAWLCGASISYILPGPNIKQCAEKSEQPNDVEEMNVVLSFQYHLQRFIKDREIYSSEISNTKSIDVDSIGYSNNCENLLQRVIATSARYLENGKKSDFVLIWMSTLLKFELLVDRISNLESESTLISLHGKRFIELFLEQDLDHTLEIMAKFAGKSDSFLIRAVFTNFITESTLETTIESILEVLNSSKPNISSTDIFDNEFKLVNKIMLQNTDIFSPNSTILGIMNLLLIAVDIKEVKRDLIFRCIFRILDKVNVIDQLYCISELIQYLTLENFEVEHSQLPIFKKLLRIMGEGPLVSHELERNELTIISISRLLGLLIPLLDHDEDLKNDWLDMASWLRQCDEKRLIITQLSYKEYAEFLILALEVDTVYEDSFLSMFTTLPGNIRQAILKHLSNRLSDFLIPRQVSFYRKLFNKFETPQESIEACASFCFFYGTIASCSAPILASSVFNLIEYARFHFFIPYLQSTLEFICLQLKLDSPLELYKTLKLDLLFFWISYNSGVSNFPFGLFGFQDIGTFISANYKDLIAVTLSSNSKDFDRNKFLQRISNLKGSDIESLVSDSFALTIALSYTKDGSKNAIHDTLKQILGKRYSTHLREKLLLVVLEVFKVLDISDEVKIYDIGYTRDIVDKLFSPTSRPSSLEFEASHLQISFHSGMELLKVIISKSYPSFSSFWIAPNTYFLMRRLSIILLQCKTSHEKVIVVRKIKLLSLFGNEEYSIDLLELAVNTLCPFLCEVELRLDICLILANAGIDSLEYLRKRTLPIVVKVMNALTQTKQFSIHERLLSRLLKYVDKLEEQSKVKPILMNVLNLLSGTEPSISINKIEQFLESESEFEECKSNGKQEDIIFLISLIFPDTPPDAYLINLHPFVVKTLIEIQSTIFLEVANQFPLWCGVYLAEYYIQGNAITHDFTKNENTSPLVFPKDFEADIANGILENAFLFLSSIDSNVAATVESIIGVLIWKFKANKAEVQGFFDFSHHYERFSAYISPLDFHCCVLLQSSESEIIIPTEPLVDVIFSLKHRIVNFETSNWTMHLFIALISDLARFTSIAPLFSTLALKVPPFCEEALPHLICTYVNLMGNKGVKNIEDLLKSFNIEGPSQTRYSKLYTRIIMMIRIGWRKGQTHLKQIYSNSDLVFFYNIAAKNHMARTALLLLEDCVAINAENKGDELQFERIETLRTIYQEIDDGDLVYGLPIEISLKDIMQRMSSESGYSSHLVKFSGGVYDAGISLDVGDVHQGDLVHSMIKSGMMGSSRLVSKDIGNGLPNTDLYEWAWKLSTWELPTPSIALDNNEIIYKCLKRLHDYPMDMLKNSMNSIVDTMKARDQIVAEKLGPREHNANTIAWLKSIASIVSVYDLLRYDKTNVLMRDQAFIGKTSWFETTNISASEDILLSRRAAFQILANYPRERQSLDVESYWIASLNELIRYNSVARFSKEQQKMVNSMVLIDEIAGSKFLNSNSTIQNQIASCSKFCSACTLWDLGETDVPVAMMKSLRFCEANDIPFQAINVSPRVVDSMLVEWTSRSRQEHPLTIMNRYVMPMYRLVSGLHNLDSLTLVFQKLAHFCESQFKDSSLNEKISKLTTLVKSRQREIEEIKSHYGKTVVSPEEKKTILRYYLKLKTQYQTEKSEIEDLESTKDELAGYSVEFYLKGISSGENDENVDKFFALWLEFSSKEKLNLTIRENLIAIPPHKLVSWGPQLISRLSNDATEFQKSLHFLIQQLCITHPYHSLYNLFSMTKQESSAKLDQTSTIAAVNIWNELKKHGDQEKQILAYVEEFCEEAIKLAELKVPKGRALNLKNVKSGVYFANQLPPVPPPTIELKVDRTSKYDNVPLLSSIDAKVEIATSGLSLPKIATFYLTDGTKHKMLLKHGADDLRQDSIMEQVFEKVNLMFWKNTETRKRNLRMRTYKAVPLGPMNGIIEFVPNSMALIDIIRPYHATADKLKAEKAREMMKSCQTKSKDLRVKVYLQIVNNIKPVLNEFFLDSFLTPEEWFCSRTLYTRGVAVSSMVGHMLGLGDRHCNNILLDKMTGEPIHIDLGVAFDQGKLLPIPETVPFRLTRDMVDGFGVTGTAGVFTKSCEHTFKVLRENKEHILAILDVLRWDPLYQWSLSPIRKNRLQGDDEILNIQPHEETSEAGRAILQVSEKIGNSLSVEAAVSELIQEAVSETNLALIYCGWSPFY